MKTCSIDGCDKAVRARGLCSTHYNHAHQPGRHAKVTVPCDQCGKPCEKQRTSKYSGRFCSLACRDEWRAAVAASRRLPVRVGESWGHCDLPLAHPARRQQRPPRVFVAGACCWCGERFVIADPGH